jgi:tagaturonate reductase
MKRISRKTHQAEVRPVRILQFGEGNFLRAFVDNFIQILNDQELINSNIAIVQPMPFGRIEAMREQDGLYTLFLEGISHGKIIKQHRIIDVVSDLIDPFQSLDTYLTYAKSTDLKVVISNTTEAGIAYVEEILSTSITPTSFPGKLLLLLKQRYDFFENKKNAVLDIVPCELIEQNGDTLKAILKQLAEFNDYDANFIHWLVNENRYYNTLVDRIVPGYPKEDASDLEVSLGYLDHSMVKGEIFHLWVIDGPTDYLKQVLPFDQSGLHVNFVNSIKPYKQRKVKILNGSHTTLVPVAYLLGERAVRESVENPILKQYLNTFIFDEVVPTIDLPKDDMEAFAQSVLERYRNPFIHHLLMSISLNSMTKYKTRVLPTVLDNAKKGKLANCALFSFASWLVFYRGVDLNGDVISLNDDQEFIDLFKTLWDKNNVSYLVDTITALDHWETDYLQQEEIKNLIKLYVNSILNDGMENALLKLMEGK